MKLQNIEVILVNPKYPENIGSVCRSMKNMGINSLSIIAEKQYDIDKIRVLAIHAVDIAENAKYYKTLADALKQATLIAGISRRRGKKRKYFAISPEELAIKISNNPYQRVALVFGNEETGLTDSELSSCHLVVNIPSSSDFPSLNLSHAVQVITYVIFRECMNSSLSGYKPISEERLEQLISVITQSLHNIGFFTLVNHNDLGVFFRDIMARSALSSKEAKRMEIVFKKISGIVTRGRVQGTLKEKLTSKQDLK